MNWIAIGNWWKRVGYRFANRWLREWETPHNWRVQEQERFKAESGLL